MKCTQDGCDNETGRLILAGPCAEHEPKRAHTLSGVASGYELHCSCGADWDVERIRDTECPDCGTEYDAVSVGFAVEHAF